MMDDKKLLAIAKSTKEVIKMYILIDYLLSANGRDTGPRRYVKYYENGGW